MVSRRVDILLPHLWCIKAFLAIDLTQAGCFNERNAVVITLNKYLCCLNDRHYSEWQGAIHGQPPLRSGWCLNNSMSTADPSPVYFKNNSDGFFSPFSLPFITLSRIKRPLDVFPQIPALNQVKPVTSTQQEHFFLHKGHAYQITPSNNHSKQKPVVLGWKDSKRK